MTIETHEQWVGLAYVERHGLPGYPPAVPEEFALDEQRREQVRRARRKFRAIERREP